MKLNEKKLKSKGWSKKEIEYTKDILLEAEKKKHPKLILLEKALYWIVLALIIGGAIAGTWLMEPIMLVATPGETIMFVAVFGLLFGTLASTLIKEIDDLELHHHLIISISIPIVTIITSVLLSRRTVLLQKATNLAVQHHPYVLGGVFALCALIPYIIFISKQGRELWN